MKPKLKIKVNLKQKRKGAPFAEFARLLKDKDITNSRAARELGISLTTIHEWRARGEVPLYAIEYARENPYDLLTKQAFLMDKIIIDGAIPHAMKYALIFDIAARAVRFNTRLNKFVAYIHKLESEHGIALLFKKPFTFTAPTRGVREQLSYSLAVQRAQTATRTQGACVFEADWLADFARWREFMQGGAQ